MSIQFSTHTNTLTPSLTTEALEEKVLQAFRLWYAHDHEGSPLSSLQLYQQVYPNGQDSVRQATNQLLRQGLDMLKSSHPDEHTILQLRFSDEQPVQVVANRMNLVDGSVLRKQQQGIRHVAEFLGQQEKQIRTLQRDNIVKRLPAADVSQVLGDEDALQELAAVLLPGQAPWLVAIEGTGGVGKTTLAETLARRIIDLDIWEDFGWVSVQPTTLNLGGELKQLPSRGSTTETVIDTLLGQLLPQALQTLQNSLEARCELLCSRLKQRPHLIVIDGLESPSEIEELRPLLRRLLNPSKVLITSRVRTFHESGTYHYTLGEMSTVDVLQLLRSEAKLCNLRDVASAADDDLRPIYTKVGGNPLALRLVVGQLHIHSLHQVLADLATASGSCMANLYDYLFRQVWEQLDEPVRYASLPLLLIPEDGDTLDELVVIAQSQEDREEFRRALESFVKLGLIDVRGNFIERRYLIHQLTRTFLRQQIIRWVGGLDSRASDYATLFERSIGDSLVRINKLVDPTDLSTSNRIVEKVKYLLELALHFETLWSPTLALLLEVAPVIITSHRPQEWLPLLKRALQECRRRGDEISEARLLPILHSLLHKDSATPIATPRHSYKPDKALPATKA